jgi:hypothetical protein
MACAAAILAGIGIGVALAEGSAALPPIDHAATRKECGDCHIPFPPQMLPSRSWHRIMGDLASHFGDNAALPAATRVDIEAYLVSNAGDAPGTTVGRRYIRGIPPDAVPLRITETPYWQGAHEEVPAAMFRSAPVKSAGNCTACHRNASQGKFGEEE